MKYEIKPFTFLVAGYFGAMTKTGFAINCELPVRLTAHKDPTRQWVISDYGTGRSVFTGDIFVLGDAERLPNMHETINLALEKVAKKIASGDYAKAVAQCEVINK